MYINLQAPQRIVSAAKGVKDLTHCTQTYRNYAVLQQLYMSWEKSTEEGEKNK